MKSVTKAIGYMSFVIAFGLSVWLVLEFHQWKISLSSGVAMLALLLSAFGLVMARLSARRGDYLSAALGVVLWMVGVGSFTITELGFWSGAYKERHVEYLEIKKDKSRLEALSDQAWKALTTGDVPASVAEIKAKIAAAKHHERWRPTKGCTDATISESQAFCQTYSNLQVQLAQTVARADLEKKLLAKAPIDNKDPVHDVFALADPLVDWFGIDQKTAFYIVILATWIVLVIARDLGLIAANPLDKRHMAVKAPLEALAPKTYEPSRTTTTGSAAAPMEQPQPPRGDNSPDGGGTPKSDDTLAVTEPSNRDATVVTGPWPEPDQKNSKQHLAKLHVRTVSRYVDEKLITDCKDAVIIRNEKGNWQSGGTQGRQIWKHYRAWCRHEGLPFLPDNKFGSAIRAHLDCTRNTKGAIYAAVIRREEKKRKVA